MGVHPRGWWPAPDPEHLPLVDTEPLRGCAALLVSLLLLAAVTVVLGTVWLAVWV